MHMEMLTAAVAGMPPSGQPLKAQLDQVTASTLPDGREVWEIDITLAVAPGVWTLVVEDRHSMERLYEEILSSGNEQFGRVPVAGRPVRTEFSPEQWLNDHEGAEFNLLSLIH